MILNATSLAVLSQTLQMRFNTGLARAVTPWNLIAMEVPSGGAENIYPTWCRWVPFVNGWATASSRT